MSEKRREDKTEKSVMNPTDDPDRDEVTAATAVSSNLDMSGIDSEPIPIPPTAPRSGASILGHKLWIGNLDKRLTEQNILQFVTKYGEVVSFRYLFKAGTDTLEPRGYVFVEFSTREEAEKAKAALDGKKALGKKLTVDWAKQDQGAKKNLQTVSETWDASTVSETLDSGVSTSAKIAALEAKLRQMEEEGQGPITKKPKLESRDPGRHRGRGARRGPLLGQRPANIKIVQPTKKPNGRASQQRYSSF